MITVQHKEIEYEPETPGREYLLNRRKREEAGGRKEAERGGKDEKGGGKEEKGGGKEEEGGRKHAEVGKRLNIFCDFHAGIRS